jgi:hypothetical protein
MSHGDNDTQLDQPLGQVTWAGRFMTSRNSWSPLSATGSDTRPQITLTGSPLFDGHVGRKPLGLMAPDSADRDCTGRRSPWGRAEGRDLAANRATEPTVSGTAGNPFRSQCVYCLLVGVQVVSYSRPRLFRSRVATSVVFVLLGALQGTLAARMPAIKDGADLSNGMLGWRCLACRWAASPPSRSPAG